MKTITTFIGSLLIALALGGLAYTSYLGVQTYEHAVRNQAVTDCLQASTKSWTESPTAGTQAPSITVEPNRYWAAICMQEKGYQLTTNLQ
jgi:hypothetical protein